MNYKHLIIIPARYGSKRFPGKPLVKIAGKSMLQHVIESALTAANKHHACKILVATDHEKIYQHAENLGVEVVMTPQECKTGTDRIIYALKKIDFSSEYIINLQGDAPLTPPELLLNIFLELEKHSCVVTPVKQLTWNQLNELRESKLRNPFSGTTVIRDKKDYAVWFSKNIIPAIRNEDSIRNQSEFSPVWQHIGIYGYPTEILKKVPNLSLGFYENLEGLEQLRLLENNLSIKTFCATHLVKDWRGVDCQNDADYVEHILRDINK